MVKNTEKKKEFIEFPKIKKKVNAFLTKEEGNISKQAILKAGVVLGGIAISLSSIPSVSAPSTHDNAALTWSGYNPTGNPSITATHGHHYEHGVGGPCNW